MAVRSALAFALLTTLAISGCSSDDGGDGTGGPTTNPTTMPTTTPTGGGGGNVTPEQFSCTAAPGAAPVPGGGNILTVSGCILVRLTGNATYQQEEITDGCEVTYDEDGDGAAEGTPQVGTKYPSGTTLELGCGATAIQGTATVGLVYDTE